MLTIYADERKTQRERKQLLETRLQQLNGVFMNK